MIQLFKIFLVRKIKLFIYKYLFLFFLSLFIYKYLFFCIEFSDFLDSSKKLTSVSVAFTLRTKEELYIEMI